MRRCRTTSSLNSRYCQCGSANYLRLTELQTLTASWMKTNPDEYAPWLTAPQTVDEFCNASVLPVGGEVEHVSLIALRDVVLSPAGITLEVLYLDRSVGTEVNMHRFSPATSI